MKQMTSLLLITLAAALLAFPTLAAPLFESDETLELAISADFNTIFKEQDKTKSYPGRLSYSEGDENHALDVQVQVRGNFRLKNCQVPGLRIHFPKGTKGPFKKQKELKLVTQCRKNSELYQDYLLQEYAVYRAYQVITDKGYLTRLAKINYLDTGKDKSWPSYAFFIEDTSDLAKRLGVERVRDNRVSRDALSAEDTNLVSLYMYLVGNTDYSLLKGEGEEACCHNAKLLTSDKGHTPIPYDFDLAGIINTSYAAPPVNLGIKKVTQRLYRGFCQNLEYLDINIALLNEKRDAIYAAYGNELIRPKTVKKMHNFLDRFYNTINNPNKLRQRITNKCR